MGSEWKTIEGFVVVDQMAKGDQFACFGWKGSVCTISTSSHFATTMMRYIYILSPFKCTHAQKDNIIIVIMCINTHLEYHEV